MSYGCCRHLSMVTDGDVNGGDESPLEHSIANKGYLLMLQFAGIKTTYRITTPVKKHIIHHLVLPRSVSSYISLHLAVTIPIVK